MVEYLRVFRHVGFFRFGPRIKENNMFAVTPDRRQQLAAMVRELQTSRTVLHGLTNWFSLFVFTGGRVPTAEWDLVATNAYLRQPAAAESPSPSELERYRRLVQTIDDMGHTATVGPRTLKCRHSLGDRFGLAASELRLVTDALECSMTKAMEAI